MGIMVRRMEILGMKAGRVRGGEDEVGWNRTWR